MTDLGFDAEQLAAALERVVFEEDDVIEAIREATGDRSAQVGVFLFQGEAQHQIHPMLVRKDGGFELHVCVFDNDRELSDPEMTPEFTVALKTAVGQVFTSRRDSWEGGGPLEVIPLGDRPSVLIGARLEYVA